MNFGTSGLRGLASDLLGPASSLYAEAFVLHLRDIGFTQADTPIFIGRDFRASSPDIRARCAAGLARQSIRVLDCGTLPTPALAAYAMGLGAPSLMITGSHIPEDRNGIKFYRPDGEIGKGDEAAIREIAEDLASGYAPPEPISSPDTDDGQAVSAFLDRCSSVLPEAALSGLRVGVYEHSSVARDVLHTVLSFFGIETVAFARSDDFVAVDTEAVSDATRNQLSEWADKYGLDAIVSTDGDADRPLVADENGDPIRGDLLGLIAAEFLEVDIAVTPVTSNSGIASTDSMKIIRTKVGSPYVIEAMKTAGGGVVAGFEANGGFLLQTDAKTPGGKLSALPTRDCFLPIIAALYTQVESGEQLSSLALSRKFPVSVADRLQNYPTEKGRALVSELAENRSAAVAYFAPIGEVTNLDTTDGSRFTLNGNQIVHYRPSGNAPELRCYCEAPTADEASELLAFGLAEARKHLA